MVEKHCCRLECQIQVAEWACWQSVTSEVKFGGQRPTHVPSRATHAPARGGCRLRKEQRMEACGLLAGVGVLPGGRSGDDAPDGGVAGRI